jgi:hypothetical protein
MENGHFEISGKIPNLTVTDKSANGKITSTNSGFNNMSTAYDHIKTEIRKWAKRYGLTVNSIKRESYGFRVSYKIGTSAYNKIFEFKDKTTT